MPDHADFFPQRELSESSGTIPPPRSGNSQPSPGWGSDLGFLECLPRQAAAWESLEICVVYPRSRWSDLAEGIEKKMTKKLAPELCERWCEGVNPLHPHPQKSHFTPMGSDLPVGQPGDRLYDREGRLKKDTKREHATPPLGRETKRQRAVRRLGVNPKANQRCLRSTCTREARGTARTRVSGTACEAEGSEPSLLPSASWQLWRVPRPPRQRTLPLWRRRRNAP